jgi:4-hydroxybenzoate polyprenyltransferase
METPMKALAVLIWIGSVLAALFFAPSITAITTIAITTMLLCVVLVLVEIRDALTRPAPSGQVGMFSSKSEES